MRTPVVVLLLASLACLGAWSAWRWSTSGPAGGSAAKGTPSRELDVAVMEVETARLVAGPPDDHPCLREETGAALAGLAARLEAEGFGPAMRRGAVPRARVAVVEQVPFEERRAAATTGPRSPDCAIFLALERFELLAWELPRDDRPGRASYEVRGRVWIQLPADGSRRSFSGDFTGRHDSIFSGAEVADAPDPETLAAAFLFGQRLLETWRRGLVWREIPQPR